MNAIWMIESIVDTINFICKFTKTGIRVSIMPFFSILNCWSNGTVIFRCNFKILKLRNSNSSFLACTRSPSDNWPIKNHLRNSIKSQNTFSILTFISSNFQSFASFYSDNNSLLFTEVHRCFNQMHLQTTNQPTVIKFVLSQFVVLFVVLFTKVYYNIVASTSFNS